MFCSSLPPVVCSSCLIYVMFCPSLPPVVCSSCLIYVMFCSSLPPVVCSSCLIYVMFCSSLHPVVGGLISYLRYVLFVFTSSCRRTHVLFTLFVLFAYIGVPHILCCVFACLRFRSCVSYVASFSWLSIFDYCPFVILLRLFIRVISFMVSDIARTMERTTNPIILCS